MIRLVILDIDCVLTDGFIIVDEAGKEMKKMNLKDMDAVFEFKQRGFILAAITGEFSDIVVYFQNRFPWDYFYIWEGDKKKAVQKLEQETGIGAHEICFVGDGKYDVEPIEHVKLGVCPANAIREVKQVSDIVMQHESGEGCLWELVQLLDNYNHLSGREYFFVERLQEHGNVFRKMAADTALANIVMAIGEKILELFEQDRKVLLCGNGGSASDAQHIAAEFISRFYHERPAMNAEALNINASTLTAVGNDYGFGQVFARQVEAKAQPGDMLIGISTSGSSENILEALRYAKGHGITTALLTGNSANQELEEFVDYLVKVPDNMTPRIQEAHIFIGHLIAEYVEQKKYGK
ncbi:MAG: SIS domain-containing protein [Lachnospiraceae bacterium]|nr:SIS domain-containing protein [Lachnospiraceae bacterium]